MTRRGILWRRLLKAAAMLALVLVFAGPQELRSDAPGFEPLSKKHMPLMDRITDQIHANWSSIRTWEGRVELARSDPTHKLWKTVTDISFIVDYVRDRRIVIITQTENIREGKQQPFDVTGILLRDDEFYLYLGHHPDGPLPVADGSPGPDAEVEFKKLEDIPESQRHGKLLQGYLRKSPRSEFEFGHLDFGRNFDPIVAMTREAFRRPYIEGMLECLEKDVPYQSRITLLHDGDKVTMKHVLPSDLEKGREGYTYVYSLADGGNLVYYFLDDGNGGTETVLEFEQVSEIWAPRTIDHRLRDVFVEHFVFLENKINEPLPEDAFDPARLGAKQGDVTYDTATMTQSTLRDESYPPAETELLERPGRRWGRGVVIAAFGGLCLMAAVAALWRRKGGSGASDPGDPIEGDRR